MTEAQLLEEIRRACAQLGLYHYHPQLSLGSEPGWPDCVIIGRRRVIFRELKSAAGTVTREQREVGRRLAAAGCDWGVWRPADWTAGRITSTLGGLAAWQPALM